MSTDLRFGIRMLFRNPGFTLTAAVALALGIGANTAIFSVLNAVMLSRLPFENPDRLVMVWEQRPRTSEPNVVNPVNFLEWQARNRSFERIAAFFNFNVGLSGGGEPEMVDCMIVSSGYFEILGIKPVLGRWFTPQEDTQGNDRVAIISEGLWRRRYAADPGIIGRSIEINNHAQTVVGIMPLDFRFPRAKADLWVPMAINRAVAEQEGRYLSTIARLRDAATISSAQAEMNVLAAKLQKERPQFDAQWGITVVDLRKQAAGAVRTPLLALMGAAGLVLLIACANVANLMLMRAAGREHEIAVRAALGAGVARIAKQLLVESLLLASLGGTLGLVLGLWSMKFLTRALPDTISYANLKTIRIDATVFLFTTAVSLATGILFGLAPALKAARAGVQNALKSGGRGSASARAPLRRALVVAEVALATTLLAGAGLLIRSFALLSSVDPGFDARHVLSMQLMTSGRHSSGRQLAAWTRSMLDRVRAVPGVEAAGTSHYLPLGSRGIPGTGFFRTDQPRPRPGSEPGTEVLVIMPGYFAAMNIPLVRGRVFDDRDSEATPPVIVINQTLARRFYPGEDPIGKVLSVQWGPHPYQIIGVVGDVHQFAMAQEPAPALFISDLQEPTGPCYLVVRTHGEPGRMARAIQAAVRSLDRNLPIADVRTMDQYMSASVAAPRFNTILFAGFAALALTLAAVGIFGVISYSVLERTREIGIRRALGASTWAVASMVAGEGMALAAAGAILGVAGALAAARLIRALLFGVPPHDPVTLFVVAGVLLAVALAASYLPARRASRVDPMVALRWE